MLEAMLSVTLNEVQWSQYETKSFQRAVFGPMQASDGYVMVAIASEKTFQGLMQVIGRPEWINDARFAKYADRRRHWTELMEGVETWSRQVSTAACLKALAVEGVPSAAYRTVAEALQDPQLAHRGALAEVEDGGGTFKVLNQPFRMSGARVAVGRKMATLGEHTRAVLKDIGLSEDEVATFATTSAA